MKLDGQLFSVIDMTSNNSQEMEIFIFKKHANTGQRFDGEIL